MSTTFKILYFATASSYTQKPEELLPGPLPLSKLFSVLEEKYPGIRKKVLSSCAVVVNLEYVDLDEDSGREIHVGDEVGIIPPVSSG